MEENLEASLSSMIGLFPPRTCCLPGLTLSDPVLQSPDREVPPKTPSPGFDTPSAQPKKVRGIIPGSAADFRRREANRLAAVGANPWRGECAAEGADRKARDGW